MAANPEGVGCLQQAHLQRQGGGPEGCCTKGLCRGSGCCCFCFFQWQWWLAVGSAQALAIQLAFDFIVLYAAYHFGRTSQKRFHKSRPAFPHRICLSPRPAPTPHAGAGAAAAVRSTSIVASRCCCRCHASCCCRFSACYLRSAAVGAEALVSHSGWTSLPHRRPQEGADVLAAGTADVPLGPGCELALVAHAELAPQRARQKYTSPAAAVLRRFFKQF